MFRRLFTSGNTEKLASAAEDLLATLKRTDHNNNTFVMRENIPLEEAEKLAKHYEDLGHHQFYFVEVQPKA